MKTTLLLFIVTVTWFGSIGIHADDSIPFIESGKCYSFDRIDSGSANRYRYIVIDSHIKGAWYSIKLRPDTIVFGWLNVDTGMVVYPNENKGKE